MPKVETIICTEPETFNGFLSSYETDITPIIKLGLGTAYTMSIPVDDIELSPDNISARIGPEPPQEQRRIERLAATMADGQIVPILVDKRDNRYFLIDGARRLKAAKIIQQRTGKPFLIRAEVTERLSALDPPDLNRSRRRDAIRANIHRAGYTPVQLAYLICDLRISHGWTGTKEVAEYLGVSRAQVSQHDKLLNKPDGMDQETYDGLIEKLNSGVIGADAAFFTLTHVQPEMVRQVLDKAAAAATAATAADTATGVAADVKPTISETAKTTKRKIEKAASGLGALKPNAPAAPAPAPAPAPTPAAKAKPFYLDITDHDPRLVKNLADAIVNYLENDTSETFVRMSWEFRNLCDYVTELEKKMENTRK